MSANTLNLTKAYIDRASFEGHPKSKDIRWDTQIRNFGVRLYSSGQKTFVLFYRFNGRQRLMKLGVYGVKTLDEARKDARQKLVTVENGTDPLTQRKDDNNAADIEVLCADYMTRYAIPHKKSWSEDQRLIKRYVLPQWGKLKVAHVQKKDVAKLHHKIGKTSIYEANRVKSLLSKMWECASNWGFVADNLANPVKGIPSFPETQRKRYIREEEMPGLADSINLESNIYIRSLFWLFLFTGLRKSELLKAKWSDISKENDGKNWSLQLPDTKSGAPLNQPLTSNAVTILKDIPKVEGNPHIFIGHLKGTHLVGIHKNWDQVRKRAGLADVRLHDIRHTVASWLIHGGQNLYIVGKVLNHGDQSTTQKYSHVDNRQIRNALDMHGSMIMEAG
jgi:integrase